MRHTYYKIAAPSIKFYTPYNHFKSSNHAYDGQFCESLKYPQKMVSCSHEESKNLEYEFEKAIRLDDGGSNYIKLSKQLLGQ